MLTSIKSVGEAWITIIMLTYLYPSNYSLALTILILSSVAQTSIQLSLLRCGPQRRRTTSVVKNVALQQAARAAPPYHHHGRRLLPPPLQLQSFSTFSSEVEGGTFEPQQQQQQQPHTRQLPYEFHVAPMQCYTNLPLRKLYSLLSPSSILWTEMEKVPDILNYGRSSGSGSSISNIDDHSSLVDAWAKRLGPPPPPLPKHHNIDNINSNGDRNSSSNLILQLGCNDPKQLKSCIERTLRDYHPTTFLKGINLNCGCPSIESGGSNLFGAKLMKDVELTYNLVQSMKEAAVAVSSSSSSFHPPPEISVKCRLGVIDNIDDIHILEGEGQRDGEDQMYERLHNYVASVRDAGADHVIIHARPAILSGLSPVKNRTVPKLNYDMVNKIASEFSCGRSNGDDDGRNTRGGDGEFRITLNGGITSLAQLEQFMAVQVDDDSHNVGGATSNHQRRHVSSHMAGRWCLRRPLDLVGVESLLIREKEQERQQLQGRQQYSQQSQQLSRKSDVDVLVEQYMDYAISMASVPPQKREITTAELCLPLYLITEQLKEDYDAFLYYDNDDYDNHNEGTEERSLLLSCDEIERIYDVMRCGMTELQSMSKGKKGKIQPKKNDVNFKQMSNCFKPIVGTKVANKWKRNRNEL